MYIEKNGYLVVYPKELSFLTEEREFSDDLNLAEIFNTNQSALEAISQFVNGEETYIVLRYNQTIWLDQDAKQPEVKNHECCAVENDAHECQCHNKTYDEVCQEIFKKYNVE